MKRFLSFTLVLIMVLILAVPAAATEGNPYSGGMQNCGYVAWECAYEHTGIKLPVFNGGAKTWYEQAKAAGFQVSKTPRARSIVVLWNPGMGHVAYVEKYDAVNNKIFIHETAATDASGVPHYHECWINATGDRFTPDQIGDGSYVIGYIYLNPKVVHVKSISLNKSAVSILPGKSFQLKAVIKPANATNKGIVWSSSNSKAVVVSSSGKVTGKAVGTAKITAKTKDGKKTASAVVTVKPFGTGITKVTPGKKAASVAWKSQTKWATGYEIQLSTSAAFDQNRVSVLVKKNTTTSRTVKNLLSGRRYYVRIRTYKTVGKNKYYSGWSGIKIFNVK